MPRLPQSASVHADTLARAESIARRTAFNAGRRRHAYVRAGRLPGGVSWGVRPAPEVWRTALRLAGGDVTRLSVQRDGSVIVRNAGRRRPPVLGAGVSTSAE